MHENGWISETSPIITSLKVALHPFSALGYLLIQVNKELQCLLDIISKTISLFRQVIDRQNINQQKRTFNAHHEPLSYISFMCRLTGTLVSERMLIVCVIHWITSRSYKNVCSSHIRLVESSKYLPAAQITNKWVTINPNIAFSILVPPLVPILPSQKNNRSVRGYVEMKFHDVCANKSDMWRKNKMLQLKFKDRLDLSATYWKLAAKYQLSWPTGKIIIN